MKVLIAAATLLLAVTVSSPAATRPSAATRAIEPDSADIHRFKIGALDAIALNDGYIPIANDGKTVGLGQPRASVAAVLTAAGLAADTIRIGIQPLLVKSGGRTLLFDTGAGSASFAVAGKLQTALRAAGVAPTRVTDIFISHAHPDHIGGLVGTDGMLAFQNAVIHMSTPEWESMKSKAELASILATITPKVVTFQPGAIVIPGVTAVPIKGHTPGHSGYEITSAGKKLLYFGDAAHHSVISLQRPDWKIAFDEDQLTARASRRKLLQRAADENALIYAYHFPFPGLGHVRTHDDAFVWEPE